MTSKCNEKNSYLVKQLSIQLEAENCDLAKTLVHVRTLDGNKLKIYSPIFILEYEFGVINTIINNIKSRAV